MYLVVSIGSMPFEDIFRYVGGGGRAAALAKNWSRILVPEFWDEDGVADVLALEVGKLIPSEWSIQVPHPWAQSFLSGVACVFPRCSTHPGHEHWKPQVHPEPAREFILLIGGIEGKSGIGVDLCRGRLAEYNIGARSGPGVGEEYSLSCF